MSVATSPAKLVAKILKILKREFVEMAELLWNNIEVEWHRFGSDTTSNQPRMPQREIPDILSWLQCFGGVVASKHPTCHHQCLCRVVQTELPVCSNLFGAEQ